MGYNVFYDIESMHSGMFNNQIINAISECSDFLLILPPNALDRCINEDDWVRQELVFALKNNKTIIPVLMNGFEFPKTLPHDIDSIRNFEGVEYSNKYFDAFIHRVQKLLSSKIISPEQKISENLGEDYVSFISSITVSDYLTAESFFNNGNDIFVTGGLFFICQQVLNSKQLESEDKIYFEKLQRILKTIYKLSMDKGHTEICSFMQTVSHETYIEASSDIKEYMLAKTDMLYGEFIEFIFQSLITYTEKPNQRAYWETLLKEVFIMARMCKNCTSIGTTELRSEYISFISSITISDYLAVENFINNGNDISVSGGLFFICQQVLDSDRTDSKGKEYFARLLRVLKTIYKLSMDKGHAQICAFMQTVARETYLEASHDITEYMLGETDTLHGEFIEFIFQSLITCTGKPKQRAYWETLLKEIFIMARMLS